MKKLKKYKLLVLVLATVCMIFGMSAKTQAAKWDKGNVEKVTKGAFTYEAYISKDGKQSWIYKVEIDKKKNTSTLKFPKKIKGKKVTKIGMPLDKEDVDNCYNVFGSFVEWYHDCDGYRKSMKGIKKVIIPDSVTAITDYSFAGLRNLETVKLPKKLKCINDLVFLNCKKLKKVTIPQNTKKVSKSAFDRCKKLKTIKVSKKNKTFSAKDGMLLSKNKDKLYYVAPAISEVEIPDTVKIIGKWAFNNSKVTNITLPKSVSKIYESGLSGKYIKTIEVDYNNQTFTRDGQCIYNKKTKKLIAVVIPENSLIVSDKVEVIPSGVSIAGTPAEYVEIGKNVKTMEIYWSNICGGADTTVKFKSVNPPEIISDIPAYVYARYPVFATLIVPKENVKEYKAWIKKNDGDNRTIKTY